jgi:hypothetical protein
MVFRKRLPKIPVGGSIHLEFKSCGKPTCRCSLHGPYAYLHRRERGRQKKLYVPMASLSKTFENIERQKAQTPKTAEILRLLNESSHD